MSQTFPAPFTRHVRSAASRLPSFFVVGAPKCGTSSFYLHLQSHPDVFAPHIKEPHFFADDFDKFRKRRTLEHYRSLFAAAPPAAICGEGSVWYLYSDRAIKNIEATIPEAQYFVLLRDPVRAVRSLHRHLLRSLDEELDDFAAAWAAQDDRAKNTRIPRHCREPRFLQYHEVYNYPPQLMRLFSLVPRDRLRIYIFEDMINDPRRHYVDALDALRLKDDGRTDFPPESESEGIRNRRLAIFLRNRVAPLWWEFADRPMFGRADALARRVGLPSMSVIKKTIKGISFESRRKPEPDAQGDGELRAFFAKSIAATESLLGRAIPQWHG